MRREMQCNWSETHPVAHALVVVAAAMALAGIVETFIELSLVESRPWLFMAQWIAHIWEIWD